LAFSSSVKGFFFAAVVFEVAAFFAAVLAGFFPAAFVALVLVVLVESASVAKPLAQPAAMRIPLGTTAVVRGVSWLALRIGSLPPTQACRAVARPIADNMAIASLGCCCCCCCNSGKFGEVAVFAVPGSVCSEGALFGNGVGEVLGRAVPSTLRPPILCGQLCGCSKTTSYAILQRKQQVVLKQQLQPPLFTEA